MVMKMRLPISFSGLLLAAALAGAAGGPAWAAESAVVMRDPGVRSVFCQTQQFNSYVKFSTPGTVTPGGGPVCYTGIGTASIDLHGVTRFWAGAHSGSFQYRDRPGLPIIVRPFTSGQSQQFNQPVEVLRLTIKS